MEIIVEKAVNAILEDDADKISDILEERKFKKDVEELKSNLQFFDFSDRNLISTVLSFASAKSNHSEPSKEVVYELIDRIGMMIDVFEFLGLVSMVSEIKPMESYSPAVPPMLRSQLIGNELSEETVQSMGDLERDNVKNLISYITYSDEITILKRSFTAPIIRAIYDQKVITTDKLMAYMATCIIEPIYNMCFHNTKKIHFYFPKKKP